MESANFHHQHHQLQEQLVGSSALPINGVGTTHAWTPNPILNNGSFNPNINGGDLINSRDLRQQNDILIPSLNSSTTTSSMIFQGLGFHQSSRGFSPQSAQELYLQRIKQELPDSPHRFTEMMNSPSSSIEDLQLHPSSYLKNDHDQRDLNIDLTERLLLGTLSSGCQINNGLGLPPGRGFFSHILPSINISNINQSSSSAISSPMEMNLQALDLLTSGRFNGTLINQSSVDDHHLGFFKQNLSYGLENLQESSHRPSSNGQISPFGNGVAAEAKRASIDVEPKAPQAPPKKSRLDTRSSCPPFKVRKEKLGDRIAALQQLVAPFGKTDTASVLMEAIGYIKFLQNQVETLSVPYMKSSRNRTSSRTFQGGLAEEGNFEKKEDLRSRGLCLVPLSCLSYVTDGGGGVWPSPTFG